MNKGEMYRGYPIINPLPGQVRDERVEKLYKDNPHIVHVTPEEKQSLKIADLDGRVLHVAMAKISEQQANPNNEFWIGHYMFKIINGFDWLVLVPQEKISKRS